MGEKRRMHTVARGYLEPFSSIAGRRSPGLWRYERMGPEPIQIGIDDATVHNDIYGFIDDAGQWTTDIEDLLAEVEGRFCAARRKLCANEPLTVADRIALADFMGVQLSRTPRALQLHRDEFAYVLREKALALAADAEQFRGAMRGHHKTDEDCEADRRAMLAGKWHFEVEGFAGLNAMVRGAPELSRWILFMRWTIYQSGGEYRFLTSDNPVATWATRFLEGEIGTETGVGFADRDVIVSVPITPSLALVARHSPHSLLAIHTTNDAVRRERSLRQWRPDLKMASAGPRDVKLLNYACVINADRYVFDGERDDRVENFLKQHFIGQTGPVRRRDGRPVGTV